MKGPVRRPAGPSRGPRVRCGRQALTGRPGWCRRSSSIIERSPSLTVVAFGHPARSLASRPTLRFASALRPRSLSLYIARPVSGSTPAGSRSSPRRAASHGGRTRDSSMSRSQHTRSRRVPRVPARAPSNSRTVRGKPSNRFLARAGRGCRFCIRGGPSVARELGVPRTADSHEPGEMRTRQSASSVRTQRRGPRTRRQRTGTAGAAAGLEDLAHLDGREHRRQVTVARTTSCAPVGVRA
jgi:hypothetical protein